MLESCFRALVRPFEGPLELDPGVVLAIWGILSLALALPAAGTLGLGGFGAFGVLLLTFGTLLVMWFWIGGALNVLAKLLGGRGTVEATLGALAQAAWPLLLVPVGHGLERLLPAADALGLVLGLWVVVLAVVFVRRVHGLSWGKAIGAWITLGAVWLLTGLAALLAGGLLVALAFP